MSFTGLNAIYTPAEPKNEAWNIVTPGDPYDIRK